VSLEAINKQIVMRFIEEVLNQGQIEVTDELVAHDFIGHWIGRDQEGRDGVRAFAARQRRESPDWHVEIEEVIAEGDKVVVRAIGSGTPAGPFLGLQPPAGKVRLPWIAIYRVVGGRIAERWTAADMASVLQQYRPSDPRSETT
jgi:predicted ester cyclase